MTKGIRRHWGAAGPKRPYFGRLVPLPATRSESVSSLPLVIAHNLHSVNWSFAIGYKESQKERRNEDDGETSL